MNAEKLFLTLLEHSIAAGWLVLAIIILRPFLRKVSHSLCCALWGLVAFRLICPFSIKSVFSLLPRSTTNLSSGQVPVSGGIFPTVSRPEELPVSSAPVINTEVVSREQALLQVMTWIWLVGILMFILYAMISTTRLSATVRDSMKQEDGYWLCDCVGFSFVFGVFRPRIIMPFNVDSHDLPYILAHERAHLERHDHWRIPFAFLLLAVFWFQPLLWVAYCLFRRDVEFACDERAIRKLGADKECKANYAKALVECSTRRSHITRLSDPLAFGGLQVRRRVSSVLKYRKPAAARMVAALLVCVIVAVCFLTDPVVKAEYSAPVEPEAPISSVSAEPNVSQPGLEASETETSEAETSETETSETETSESDLDAVHAEIEKIIKREAYVSLRHFKMWWGDSSSDGFESIVYQNVGTEDGTVTLLVAYGGGTYPHFENYGAELLTIRIPAGETVVCPLNPGYSYESCGYIIVGSSYGTVSHNIFINQDAFRINNVPLSEYLKNSTHPTLSERTFG